MDKIITQLLKNATKEFDKTVADCIINGGGLNAILSELSKSSGEVNLSYIKEIIETLDKNIRNDHKTRKEAGITVHQKDIQRRLVTSYGVLTFKRTYYKLKNGKRVFLADEILKIPRYMRVSDELCAVLVNKAAETSMRKAAAETGNLVSAQTVCNKIQTLPEQSADAGKSR